MDGEKVSLGRCCYKNLITPADLSVSGPQPLRPGNYESLKLSSPTGSSNRVGHSFNFRRQPERPGSAGILPASAGRQDGGATPLPPSTSAAVVPAVDGLHGGLVPGGVGGVGGAAVAVGADFPPVDAGEPGLFVEGGEKRVVAFGLDFEIDGAGRIVPGSAVGFGDAGKAGLGEEDGLLKARLARRRFSGRRRRSRGRRAADSIRRCRCSRARPRT